MSRGGDWETFYDPLQHRIVVLQLTHVYVFERCSARTDPVYFCLPSKRCDVEALAVSWDNRYLAMQSNPLQIVFIDFGLGEGKEMEVNFPSGYERILALTFMRSQLFDLVVCFKNRVDMFKYNTGKRSLGKAVKSVSCSAINTWIDPLEGIILLSSSKTKGEIQVYNLLKDEAGSKKVKGYSLTLRLRKPDAPTVGRSEKQKKDVVAQQQYLEIPQALTISLHIYSEVLRQLEKKQAEGFQLQKLLLVCLYARNVLFHYNQAQGMIQIYKLSLEKHKKPPATILLDPACEYSLHVSDNLLFVLNLNNSSVAIYDTKGFDKVLSPLCTDSGLDLSHINECVRDELENGEALKSKEKDGENVVVSMGFDVKWEGPASTEDIEDVHVDIHCNYVDELKAMEEMKDLPENKASVGEQFDIRKCIYLDSGIVYYPDNKFFNYLLNKGRYLRLVNKGRQGIINMMRRRKTKEVVLEAIKQSIVDGVSLNKISKLFGKISAILKAASTRRVRKRVVDDVQKVVRITCVVPLVSQAELADVKVYSSQIIPTLPTVFALINM